jgi:hypothetical protein
VYPAAPWRVRSSQRTISVWSAPAGNQLVARRHIAAAVSARAAPGARGLLDAQADDS